MSRSTPPASDERYRPLEEMLELAIALHGAFVGLGYEEIAERWRCSEKTAKRRVKALRSVFGEALVAEKRPGSANLVFRLRHDLVSRAAARFSAEEMAALEGAIDAARQSGHRDRADELRRVVEKARAVMDEKALTKLDANLEALLDAQGLAMRPGPQPVVEPTVIDTLRHAILAGRGALLRHDHAGRGRTRVHRVTPLGFLYGIRHYLVAWHARRTKVLLFRLSRIASVEVLPELAEIPDAFRLPEFAARSFGVFQEAPVETVWRFAPRVADEAREYVFHPNEEKTDGEDGSLQVRFTAGGTREMAWHLFTWGPDVEVLKPVSLRREMVQMLEQALKAHGREPRRAGALRARSSPARPAD